MWPLGGGQNLVRRAETLVSACHRGGPFFALLRPSSHVVCSASLREEPRKKMAPLELLRAGEGTGVSRKVHIGPGLPPRWHGRSLRGRKS